MVPEFLANLKLEGTQLEVGASATGGSSVDLRREIHIAAKPEAGRRGCWEYQESSRFEIRVLFISASIVRPDRGLPAGVCDLPFWAGLSDDVARLDGLSGRVALTHAGQRVPAGQR